MTDKQSRLDALKKKIESDMTCPLKDAATNLVFGKGNPDADVMFIGEAPGQQEDLQGLPFVGAAGKNLDVLLHKIGLSINEVYIANILKYRPPNNRNPIPDEIVRHTPYLIEQIRIIGPKVIVTLGNFATKFCLAGFKTEGMDKVPGITKLHGKAKHVEADGIEVTVFPMYHPAAMLYKPQLREMITIDFLRLKNFLEEKAEKKKDKSLLAF